jgi:hypothetical protein
MIKTLWYFVPPFPSRRELLLALSFFKEMSHLSRAEGLCHIFLLFQPTIQAINLSLPKIFIHHQSRFTDH